MRPVPGGPTFAGSENEMGEQNDFSRGSVWKHIVNLAVPMTVAQIINVLYNIVDRIYIGHIPGAATDALTGVVWRSPLSQ